MARDSAGHTLRSSNGGCSKEEDLQVQDPKPACERVAIGRTAAQYLPSLWFGQVAPHRVLIVWLVQEPRRHRRRLSGIA
jgi:hypothetical protein